MFNVIHYPEYVIQNASRRATFSLSIDPYYIKVRMTDNENFSLTRKEFKVVKLYDNCQLLLQLIIRTCSQKWRGGARAP